MNGILKSIPILETVSSYKKEYFRLDLVAALTVAVVALPQSMAYAVIAGVDPAYGLYTAIVLCILGSAFGSSNQLMTGPTNAIALLIAANMAIYAGQENFYTTLFLLTFMVGFIQFVMGVLRLGKLVNYVSHSVIVGFTAGAAVIIAIGQLASLLGVSYPKGHYNSLQKLTMTFSHIDTMNYYAFGIGLLCIATVIISKKISKNIPGALLGIVISVILVMTMNLDQFGLKLAGEIPTAIPPFHMVNLFDFQAMGELANGALVIAIIGLVEAVAISKAIAAQTGQKINPNTEFIGQGIANMGGGFFSCIAGSGSFTRSAVCFQNGGVTRLAGVLCGIITLVVLIFLAPYAKYIPNAALAGVIMTVAYSMIDKKAIRKVLKTNKNDAFVLCITFLMTVLAPELEYAIYSGVALSLLLYLKDTASVSVKRLVPVKDSNGKFVEYEVGAKYDQSQSSPISIIQIEGNLYFGSSSDLESKLDAAHSDSKVVIVRFKGVSAIDITSLEIIENFVHKTLHEGKKVMLYGVNQQVKEQLEKGHVISLVGEDNVFMSEEDMFVPSAKTLEQANSYAAG
ncbi:SulP family inorganic anion transporter [Desulfolucanica intricata]|uniref:SulP family inorganic anion transporter n=1 Tax=Desulfolucanica intricata TaxID=1285191 RepID=UPI000A9CC918|nr:SulP family inorganic anion transporter [Desulfolucanica intricata]